MKNNKDIIRIEFSQTELIVILILSFLFYIAAILLWKQNTIDNEIVIHFNYTYKNDMYFNLAKMFSRYGMSFIAILYSLIIYLSFRKHELEIVRPLYFLIIISFFLTTLGGDLLKELIDKARPVISLSGQVSIMQITATPAFPSGHAAKSMALALPFFLLAPRNNNLLLATKIILLITASFVCFSRIALQAHFLSDVLAGIGTALFFIPFAVLLTNKFYNKLKVDEVKLTLLSKRFVIIFIVFAVILGFM